MVSEKFGLLGVLGGACRGLEVSALGKPLGTESPRVQT